jgi:hypothetical protein
MKPNYKYIAVKTIEGVNTAGQRGWNVHNFMYACDDVNTLTVTGAYMYKMRPNKKELRA